MMTPRFRRFALTAHVASSVGWLGTVAGFQALAIAAVRSHDLGSVRAFYLSMELIGWYVIVPFCLASLVTGLVLSLATPWGLFRHYWVLVKFLITTVSALILFGFTQTLGSLGALAAQATLSMNELQDLRQSPVLHSGGGMLAILVATILAVYKPWGMTPYGRRRREAAVERPHEAGSTMPWKLKMLLGILAVIVLFLIFHLVSGGWRGH